MIVEAIMEMTVEVVRMYRCGIRIESEMYGVELGRFPLFVQSILFRAIHERPRSISELARIHYVSRQSMRNTVAGWLEKGLVELRPHPTDGARSCVVALTEAGIRTMKELEAPPLDFLASVAHKFDLKAVQEATSAIRQLRRELAARFLPGPLT
jgi:DNA-binding MarR family transcriptional regulator